MDAPFRKALVIALQLDRDCGHTSGLLERQQQHLCPVLPRVSEQCPNNSSIPVRHRDYGDVLVPLCEKVTKPARERIIFIGEVPNARTRAVYHQRPQVRVAVLGDTGQRRLPSRHNRRNYVIAPWSQQLCGFLPARPDRQRLLSGSCSSGSRFRSTLPPHDRSP